MNKITLKVTQGSLSGKEFTFEDRTTCVIGRALDCNILLPDDQAHSTISRYHCLLDINPPDICVSDFGSLNGTFVNNQKIGQRSNEQAIDKAQQMIYPEYELNDGDEIKLGETVFQVNKEVEKVSVQETQAINNEEKQNTSLEKPVADPLDQINKLLGEADKGNDDLIAIKGYHIIKELGKGNMGAVYLAARESDTSHDGDELQVALKVMLPKVEGNSKSHQQFIREAKNNQLLNHKNIVGVHEVGCSENTFFFTTDYCEAGSVAQLIKKRGGKLPLFLALKIMLQVLDGLQYAHTIEIPTIVLANGKKTSGVGLVHRDIKPGNILLSQSDGTMRAKIADFGLAKAFDTAGLSGRTATGVSAGTPYYMPRQQVINFKLAKPEVDVWATAATFYRMVTGKHPRQYNKQSDPWLTTLKTSATPIREHDSSIPEALAEVIDKALVDKPEIGFKSAIELKEELLKVI